MSIKSYSVQLRIHEITFCFDVETAPLVLPMHVSLAVDYLLTKEKFMSSLTNSQKTGWEHFKTLINVVNYDRFAIRTIYY